MPPDSIPYSYEPSLGRRLLKAPAAVLHLATRPLKWGMIWIQENRVLAKATNIFLNEEGTAGFYPNFSIGGRTDFAVGITYFNRDLFKKGHSLDANTFYTNPQNFKLDVNYKIPPNQLRRYQFNMSGNIRLNDDQDMFVGGNSGSEDQELDYEIEQYRLQMEAGYLARSNMLATVNAGLRHTAVNPVSFTTETGERIEEFTDAGGFGFGKTTLLNAGLGATVDRRKGISENENTNLISTVTTSYNFKQTKTRVYSGALYDAGISFNRSLNSAAYQYLNYYGEWQQYLTIPGLPLTRRFAFRGRLEKRYPLGSGSVPFYDQSILGSADDLRGYEQDRFRDLGYLLLTLEYRYPIWDTWDAVLFTDQGQVFNEFNEIGLKRFHGSLGTGLRFMTAADFLFRAEIAFSKEGARSLLEFNMNF